MSNETPPLPSRSHALPDWFAAAARPLDARLIASVTVVVPALLAAGVYWLRHYPAKADSRQPDYVVEVRLLPPREGAGQSPSAPSPPSGATIVAPLEPPPRTSDSLFTEPVSRLSAPEAATVAAPAASSVPVRSAASANRAVLMFRQTLLTHIARYQRYPEEARRAGLKGSVELLFSMRRDGAVTDAYIRTSSGQRLLDAAAMETIRRAQPLPKIPSELPDHLTIRLPVVFEVL